MAEATREGWEKFFDQYHIAWALILINIGLQYYLERRNHKAAPWELIQLNRSMGILWIEAFAILLFIPVYHVSGLVLGGIAVIWGIIGTFLSGQINILVPVDFEHLTERIMLYVVFTFGEMIIAVASYFESGIAFILKVEVSVPEKFPMPLTVTEALPGFLFFL